MEDISGLKPIYIKKNAHFGYFLSICTIKLAWNLKISSSAVKIIQTLEG